MLHPGWTNTSSIHPYIHPSAQPPIHALFLGTTSKIRSRNLLTWWMNRMTNPRGLPNNVSSIYVLHPHSRASDALFGFFLIPQSIFKRCQNSLDATLRSSTPLQAHPISCRVLLLLEFCPVFFLSREAFLLVG